MIPPTIDSYKIGNEMRKTIYVGANLEPLKTRNKNTNAAVGKLLNTVINGFKNKYTHLKEPARSPKINATNKLVRNPIKVLKRVHPMDK